MGILMQMIDTSVQSASVTEQQSSFIAFITFAVIGFRNIFSGFLVSFYTCVIQPSV